MASIAGSKDANECNVNLCWDVSGISTNLTTLEISGNIVDIGTRLIKPGQILVRFKH